MALDLPDFPWDALAPYAATARRHAGGIVDLSVGSPVDPTPGFIRDALIAATDAPGYPQTIGTPALRSALVDWHARRRGAALTEAQVLPTVGSKEFIALLPALLGLGAGDIVVQPTLAYPTYAVGAAIAGATAVASDDPLDWPTAAKLVWVNSPGNPDGRVWSVEQLRRARDRARELGAVLASDECYAELDWGSDAPTPSLLDERVTDGDPTGLLAVYSLSKQSNLAGYRAALVAGDAALIAQLTQARKHAGLMLPAPVQAAMAAALGDDSHVAEQKERYRARRAVLRPALEGAGFTVDRSEAGLYLWATRDERCWATVAWLAERGILVAPGEFYGPDGGQHVRVALTATDERIHEAARRLG